MTKHAIMFHHLHDDAKHPASTGSISAAQLHRLIDHYGDKLVSAGDWLEASSDDDAVALSFDDTLLCQYDVAAPVLTERGLTAFWFVYTAPLSGGVVPRLEVYRKFRETGYISLNNFYAAFNARVERSFNVDWSNYNHSNWSDYPFYSEKDTKFRYIRDSVLKPEEYTAIMDEMIDKDMEEQITSRLWLTPDNLRDLDAQGHVIGLHSHTHPMRMTDKNITGQIFEYGYNYEYLYDLLGKSPGTMSHPCNCYDENTLLALAAFGITTGFRANMREVPCRTELEYPREDVANIVRRLGL